MTAALTWTLLATVKAGAWLVLDCDHTYTIGAIVHTIPAGTQCVIMENGLNKIWGGIVVSVEDEAIAKRLIHAQEDHNGCMLVEPVNGEPLSPFCLQEADIADWVE